MVIMEHLEKYQKITEKISAKKRKISEKRRKETGVRSFVQIRSAHLRFVQDPQRHEEHSTKLVDLNGDNQFDIPFCTDCDTVLIDPEVG